MNDYRRLRHFLEVGRQGSFTVAARKLGISTPALSKSVAGLERQMGIVLFFRTTRALQFSTEGQSLFDRLTPLFENIDAEVDHVGTGSQEPVGRVRLSTVTAFGKHCIVPLLPELFSRHPGIELVMSFHDGARGLSRQSYDIRINWGERREQGKVAQTLSAMPLTLVASPDYLARHGTPRKPQDLARHECVATAMANDSRSHWIFTHNGARRNSQLTQFEFVPQGRLVVMDELDAVVDAARAGLGLTVMSADCIIEELRDGALVRLLPNYAITGNSPEQSQIIMQYPARKQLTRRVGAVVHFLLDKLRRCNPPA